ncbi:HAD-IIB family hydrolase [Alkalihalobacillus hwajinpoensis]|uniref:HAD-IIB family hydrolase n=1 Tax=Guptibacillus hwajinpoensis TaxID=208199 RepID=UPI0018846A1A|nr:HAD-IIB family hydrolase [Pseudalkalibacillus hwajinpoensis]MBF0705614.1 HAD-IIB family hydrolase [Pseudalkalibacillus hwajinpoensis]
MAFYMFDVDGVLTDENARPDKEVVKMIEKLATEGHILSFVTGRSRGWLSDHLFPLFDDEIDWSSLYCVSEHGAIKGRGTDISSWELDEEYVIADEVKDKLYKVSQKEQYDGLIQWDQTKESMGTVEAVHGDPGDKEHLKKTREALQEYADDVDSISSKSGNKTVVSTYGVDVIHPDLSKKIGATWIIDEIQSADKVFVFGDSSGDMVMAVTAKEHELNNITFHWVGEGETPQEKNITSISSKKSYSEGTKELLEKHIG